MSDLELFHKFCTSTYTTFSDDAMIQIIWQHAIPKPAYSSVYVMHGIMAVSALQLAKSRLEMKEAFVSHARAHYARALNMARPAVANISAQNAAEVYAFSMITVVFALGSPRTAEDILFVENEGIADWLYLLRGILVIIGDFYETLHQGILGPMFLKGRTGHGIGTLLPP
ncbi:hypothetical protein LTR10_022415 [Elasticomyces elasticus]|uniref:Transcription factor domain-containing protein n=1 Tax=Exophiala sideris TaxID=1016849 RepID=A0ABR0JMK5_9EURO|nr:hypothetical protein LTR10_022415 [Elasticomyces elasticus]KAK5037739.1 hypothetical protein LTS07_001206 [Exophiala sideris]KAK5043721.1 hypothetical protein LTR13_000075 [Exophiala sideris]KAK5067220.1 hypothetical protein LTR69_001207 [Exophiala sideris]KAK5182553.1 hypothetical protein LTR44_004944 [Eurotiomycetes sp. CCFEE 6388]